jgi:hypothetical protein
MMEKDTRILVGALNWLMLQYDVSKPITNSEFHHKEKVQRIITKVLQDYQPNMSDTHLFRELYLSKDD